MRSHLITLAPRPLLKPSKLIYTSSGPYHNYLDVNQDDRCMSCMTQLSVWLAIPVLLWTASMEMLEALLFCLDNQQLHLTSLYCRSGFLWCHLFRWSQRISHKVSWVLSSPAASWPTTQTLRNSRQELPTISSHHVAIEKIRQQLCFSSCIWTQRSACEDIIVKRVNDLMKAMGFHTDTRSHEKTQARDSISTFTPLKLSEWDRYKSYINRPIDLCCLL